MHEDAAERIALQLGFTPEDHAIEDLIARVSRRVVFDPSVGLARAIWSPKELRTSCVEDEDRRWALACLLAGMFVPNHPWPTLTRVAGALLMPRGRFFSAMSTMGMRPAALAESFGVRESAAALRIGECSRRPVALAAGDRIYSRGRRHDWPTTPLELRRLAKCPPIGFTVERITDEPGRRVALIFAS